MSNFSYETLAKLMKRAIDANQLASKPSSQQEFQQLVASWAELILPNATDKNLQEAFVAVSGGRYGSYKISTTVINQAINEARSKRVRDWLERSRIAIDFQPPYERELLYEKVFYDCIAGGGSDTAADQHGRQALERANEYFATNSKITWRDILDQTEANLKAGSFRRPELALPSSRTKDNYLVSARDIVIMIPEAGQKRQLTAGPTRNHDEPVERPRAVQAAIEAARRKLSLQAEEERRKQERLRQQRDEYFQRITGIDPATVGPQR
jgi:hypothetical protein